MNKSACCKNIANLQCWQDGCTAVFNLRIDADKNLHYELQDVEGGGECRIICRECLFEISLAEFLKRLEKGDIEC